MPLPGIPEAPNVLTGKALEHFNFVSAELSAIGVTKRLDTEALTLMADLWDHYWKLSAVGDVKGMCAIAARWLALAGRFGLTPADRAKIMSGAVDKPDEQEDRYFRVTG
jgi:phage terminase small subunit